MVTFMMTLRVMLNRSCINSIVCVNFRHWGCFYSITKRYCGFNYALLILDWSQKAWVFHIGDQTNLLCSKKLQTLRLLYLVLEL